MQEHFDAIYRDLLFRHHAAARRADGLAFSKREELFQLLEGLRREYPDEAAHFDKLNS